MHIDIGASVNGSIGVQGCLSANKCTANFPFNCMDVIYDLSGARKMWRT